MSSTLVSANLLAAEQSDVTAFGVELETCSCPLGCTGDDELVVEGQDRLHRLPGRFRVVRCCQCGLMRTNPRPTRATIGAYYPSGYGPHAASSPARGLVSQLRKARPVCDRLFRFYSEIIPGGDPGFLLEIGCATGRYLQRLRSRGWIAQGIEASAEAAALARANGLSVQVSQLEDAPEPARLYDAIAAWMVIEHLHDPLAELRRLARWTRPGGTLLMSVPNAGSSEFAMFGTYWYALELPRHLFHFTPQSITAVLERAGWSVERIVHQRNLNNVVGSIGYWMEQRAGLRRVAERLIRFPADAKVSNFVLYPLAVAAAAWGQTGRMTIVAKKRHK